MMSTCKIAIQCFILGSKKLEVIEVGHDLTATSYPLRTIENRLIRQLVESAGEREGRIVIS